MSASRRAVIGVALGALALVPVGCNRQEPVTEPAATALRLFEAASSDPAPEQVDGLFGPVEEGLSRATLLDSMAELARAGSPEVTDVVELAELATFAVDLVARLPGGGTARYSVQVVAEEDGSYRVRWFQGPGVEWPSQARRRGPGLTTSNPPE